MSKEQSCSGVLATPARLASTFDAKHYAENHDFQFGSNLTTIKLLQSSFSRAPDGTQQFLDLGCGTGDFTLLELLPRCQPCRRIVAVDSSQKMIQYAREKFAHSQITYDVLDIRGDFAEFLGKYGKFERVYSFYVLHWVRDQYTAFQNISDLMTPEGECLLIFAACLPIYNIWRRMVKMDRWKAYTEVTESFIPPTHDMEDGSALISHMLDVLKCAGLKPRTCEVLTETIAAEHLDEIINLNMGYVPILSVLPEEEKNVFKREFENEIRKYWTEESGEHRNHYAKSYLIHAIKV